MGQTIFLTGDVHDMSMGREDQAWLKQHTRLTEIECALKYAELAGRYHLKLTLFLSGNLVENELPAVKQLAAMKHVEIGGHTYNAFLPPWRHLLFDVVFRSYYGPRSCQKADIRKTVELLNHHLNSPVRAWRTHGYRSDETTLSLLPAFGIEVISDEVSPAAGIRKIPGGLLSLPINTPPDHEHLRHGSFSEDNNEWEHLLIRSVFNITRVPLKRATLKRFAKEIVKRGLFVKTPLQAFGEQRLDFPEWWQWVNRYIKRGLEHHGFATLLLHPVCWEILDGMSSLETVFKELSQYQSAFASEAGSL